MQSIDGNPRLNDNINTQIGNNCAIYVYYQGTGITQPKVICISIGPPAQTSNNTWYRAGQNESGWTKLTDSDAITAKNPNANPGESNAVTENDLTNASPGDIDITQSNDYTIKLDKIPKGVGANKKIKYRTKNINVEVEKTEGSSESTSKVPQGYVRYKHQVSVNSPKFKHNGFELNGITGTNVTAVYVYYEKDNDPNHEFPLIVCVKGSPIKYYERGNQWTQIGELDGQDPETLQQTGKLTELQNKLNDVKGKFEVKLEKTDTSGSGTPYTARPDTQNHQITVTAVGPDSDQKFKGFKHILPGTSDRINRITIHGHAIEGITELNNGTGFSDKRYVYVYFEISNTNNTKPLLICLFDGGSTKVWYKREKKQNGTGYEWKNADAEFDSTKDPNNISGFADNLYHKNQHVY